MSGLKLSYLSFQAAHIMTTILASKSGNSPILVIPHVRLETQLSVIPGSTYYDHNFGFQKRKFTHFGFPFMSGLPHIG
jgi:hypothetical protein